MQFKTQDDTDNSGVFVRFPNPGDDPNSRSTRATRSRSARASTATASSRRRPRSTTPTARTSATRAGRPVERLRDPVRRRHLHDRLNGKVVNTFHADGQPGPHPGYIGIQNHGHGDHVSFRDIRVQELGAAPSENISTRSASRARDAQRTAASTATRALLINSRSRCRRRSRSACRATTRSTRSRCGCPTPRHGARTPPVPRPDIAAGGTAQPVRQAAPLRLTDAAGPAAATSRCVRRRHTETMTVPSATGRRRATRPRPPRIGS